MMMKKPNPVKRSKHLVTFSHDHHHGLVFSSRLRKTKGISIDIIKDFVVDFWLKHLCKHFELEEKLILPLINENKLRQQFLADHQKIKDLVEKVGTKNDSIDDLCMSLSVAIAEHIRFEERELFEWLQQNLKEESLGKIGQALSSVESCAHNFSNKFWENEN